MSDSISSVQVLSIDEEKLKYRVIVCVNAPNSTPKKGRYHFVIPPLSTFGNSNHYNQCKIHLDSFTSNAIDLTVNDAVWDIVVPGAGHVFTRANAIEISLDAPSTQTAINYQTDFNPGDDGIGKTHQGGFRQLVPLTLSLCGGPGITAGLATLGDYAYLGLDCGNSDGIMCANPFGGQSSLTLRFPGYDSLAYLASSAAGVNSADVGTYCFQFTMTMIPNRQ